MSADSRANTAETAVILVRHGESLGNAERRFGGHGPTPLSERGHRQARAAAERLAEEPAPTAVISSDLVRAIETAEHISDATGAPLSHTPGLRERGLGVWDGLTFTEVEQRYPDGWKRLLSRDPDLCPDGGESARSAFSRVGETLDRIVREHAGGRVVLVSHAFAIFHAFAHICGLDPFCEPTRVFIRPANASLTRATHLPHDIWRLDALNEVHHLVGLD